jgi:hypothetical protein
MALSCQGKRGKKEFVLIVQSVFVQVSCCRGFLKSSQRVGRPSRFRIVTGGSEVSCCRGFLTSSQRAGRPSRFRIVTGGSDGQRGGQRDCGIGSTCSTWGEQREYVRHSKQARRPELWRQQPGEQCEYVRHSTGFHCAWAYTGCRRPSWTAT